jgi:hypothetical protein
MAEQMVMMELLTSDCGNDCKGMLKEKLKKKIGIVLTSSFAIVLIISLCIAVSVLHEKKKPSQVDCVLRPTLEKVVIKTCSYVDQYPLSNEVYAMICVNDTIQIDIRRFHSGKPGNEGITLSKIQWQYLKASVDHMDGSILKAQNHI